MVHVHIDPKVLLNEKELEYGDGLAHGSFGDVFRGKYQNSRVVAIKNQKIKDDEQAKYIETEIEVLSKIDSIWIVRFIGAYMANPNLVVIVTEYYSGGTLKQLILSGKEMSWNTRLDICKGIASAIMYLHEEMNYIHRDVKSENVLLDNHQSPKLCDFGFSRSYQVRNGDRGRLLTLLGTDAYMAPEIAFGMAYNEKADIFSFGIVLAEMVCFKVAGSKRGDFLFREAVQGFAVDKDALYANVNECDAPPSLFFLCEECLTYEFVDRPSASECFNWIDDLISERIQRNTDLDHLAEAAKECLQSSARRRGSRSASVYSSTIPSLDNIVKSMETELQLNTTTPTLKLLRGNVIMRGGRIKLWRKRFMTVTPEGVDYAKTEEDCRSQSKRQTIRFADIMPTKEVPKACYIVGNDYVSKENCIRIMTKSRARYFHVADAATANAWMHSINESYAAWKNEH